MTLFFLKTERKFERRLIFSSRVELSQPLSSGQNKTQVINLLPGCWLRGTNGSGDKNAGEPNRMLERVVIHQVMLQNQGHSL